MQVTVKLYVAADHFTASALLLEEDFERIQVPVSVYVAAGDFTASSLLLEEDVDRIQVCCGGAILSVLSFLLCMCSLHVFPSFACVPL